MKLMNFYILGGALVLLIILTASCACCDFKPHSKKVAFARYEGMEDGETLEDEDDDEQMEGFEDEDEDDEEEDIEGFEDEEDDEDEQFGPYEGLEEDDDEEEDEEPESMMSQIKNGLSGFMGKGEEGMTNSLEPRAYSDDTLYDIYGPPTKGSQDCGARSAGLTNSKGPLCLSDEQLKMLETRGGNATCDSQIGACSESQTVA